MKVRNPRDALVRLVTFLGGIYFVVEFLLPQSILESSGISGHHEAITNGFLAAVYVSVGLGIMNLLMVHGSKIVFRRTGAPYSAVLLGGLLLMVTVSGIDWVVTLSDAAAIRRIEVLQLYAETITQDATAQRGEVPPVEARIRAFIPALQEVVFRLKGLDEEGKHTPDEAAVLARLEAAISEMRVNSDSTEELPRVAAVLGDARVLLSARLAQVREQRVSKRIFSLLFQGIFTALGSSMFALLAFYIAAAAFRAFRIQSIESVLMMVAALLVILGQTSVGLMISESFASIRLWLLEVPSAGVFRAVKLGAGVASLVLCFRMWFSIEAKSFTGGTTGG